MCKKKKEGLVIMPECQITTLPQTPDIATHYGICEDPQQLQTAPHMSGRFIWQISVLISCRTSMGLFK